MRADELVAAGLYRLAKKRIDRLRAGDAGAADRAADHVALLEALCRAGALPALLRAALDAWTPPARAGTTTLLHLAATRGCVASTHLLLRRGYQMVEDAEGRLPLHSAALAGHAGVCHALLEVYPSVTRFHRDRVRMGRMGSRPAPVLRRFPFCVP